MRNHEELFLGKTFEIILGEAEAQAPRITEQQFEREVLDILANFHDPEWLIRYLPYVQGNFAYYLNVVDNNDHGKVLFTVPALLQSPVTTVPTGNGMSAENFFKSLKRDLDLGGKHVHTKVRDFMNRITEFPDYQKAVVEPLRDILARYGRTITPPRQEGQLGQPVPALAVEQPAVKTTNSFSDEYED